MNEILCIDKEIQKHSKNTRRNYFTTILLFTSTPWSTIIFFKRSNLPVSNANFSAAGPSRLNTPIDKIPAKNKCQLCYIWMEYRLACIKQITVFHLLGRHWSVRNLIQETLPCREVEVGIKRWRTLQMITMSHSALRTDESVKNVCEILSW